MNHLENLKMMMTGEKALPPIAQLLGLDLIDLEEGRAVMDMEASEKFHNSMGT